MLWTTKGGQAMDLGEKLRTARTKAGLTQEQVAEQLGVSRQTVSNWENNRTYPDIVSVVRLSSLCDLSLDTLLKEEKTMTNYTEYLAESTDLVRSRNRLARTVQIGMYLVVWVFSMMMLFFVGNGYGNYVSPAQGEHCATMVFYGILPLSAMIVSYLIGSDSAWGKGRRWSLLFFTVMYAVGLLLANDYVARDATFLFPELLSLPTVGMLVLNFLLSFAGVLFGEKTRKKRAEAVKAAGNAGSQQ